MRAGRLAGGWRGRYRGGSGARSADRVIECDRVRSGERERANFSVRTAHSVFFVAMRGKLGLLLALVLFAWWLFRDYTTHHERGEPYLEPNLIFESFEYDPQDRFNFDTKCAWAAVAVVVAAGAWATQ